MVTHDKKILPERARLGNTFPIVRIYNNPPVAMSQSRYRMKDFDSRLVTVTRMNNNFYGYLFR